MMHSSSVHSRHCSLILICTRADKFRVVWRQSRLSRSSQKPSVMKVVAGSMQLAGRAGTLQALRHAPAARQGAAAAGPRRAGLRVYAMDSNMERSLLGEDFGARDPTPGEIGSNFAEKTLGNYDTEHIIKPPEAIRDIVGLRNRKCVPCEGDVKPLAESDVNKMRMQVPGWKVRTNKAGMTCLAYEWKVRNFKSGLDLFHRIAEIAEAEGHHPDLHLEGYNNVVAEMTTHAAGGLTENDFIVAAKINDLELGDLMPKSKPRFWA